jgi:hypothetical protein
MSRKPHRKGKRPGTPRHLRNQKPRTLKPTHARGRSRR